MIYVTHEHLCIRLKSLSNLVIRDKTSSSFDCFLTEDDEKKLARLALFVSCDGRLVKKFHRMLTELVYLMVGHSFIVVS